MSQLSILTPKCATIWPTFYYPDLDDPFAAFYSVLQRVGRLLTSSRGYGLAGTSETRARVVGHMCLTPGAPVTVTVCHSRMERFLAYARCMIDMYVPVLSDDEADFSWEAFTANSNRSKEYLEQLKQQIQSEHTIDELFAWSFLKEEPYAAHKFPRSICALSNNIKAIFGPLFRALDKVLFSRGELSRHFVKNVPVKERPAYIEEELGDRKSVV